MPLLANAFPSVPRPHIHNVRCDERIRCNALFCKAPLCLSLCSTPHLYQTATSCRSILDDMTESSAVADIINCRCRLESLSVQPTQWCSWSFGGILGISYRQRRERIASARHAPSPSPSCVAEFNGMCHVMARQKAFCCSIECGASGKPPWLCVSCSSCLHSHSANPMQHQGFLHTMTDAWHLMPVLNAGDSCRGAMSMAISIRFITLLSIEQSAGARGAGAVPQLPW